MHQWQPVKAYRPPPMPIVPSIPFDWDDIEEAEREAVETVKREGKIETE